MSIDKTFPPYSADWVSNARSILGESACRKLGIYELPPDFLLSVVIPVYNEEGNLRRIVEQVAAVPIRKEIVLVDDCSRDGSMGLIRELAASCADAMNSFQFTGHSVNQGKGAALRTGFGMVSGTVVIVQDADLEYSPSEYPRLLQPIIEGTADVVYGSRFLGDGAHRVLYFWHYLGNKFLTTLSNCFTNLNLTDMETCYKVFRGEVIRGLAPSLIQNRFGFEPEITARISRQKLRIYEMAISYSGRTYAEGKKIGWRDGVKAIWCIVRYGLFN